MMQFLRDWKHWPLEIKIALVGAIAVTVLLIDMFWATGAPAQYQCPPYGCPLPPPGTYMPVTPGPYRQPDRDRYYRPLPPGTNLEREFRAYGGRCMRRDWYGNLVPC